MIMERRNLLKLGLAGAATLLTKRALAEPLPAPTEALKDYSGKAVVQFELPDPVPQGAKKGDAALNPGLGFWIDMRQSYVWPDRMMVDLSIQGATQQRTLVLGNIERTFSPTTGYVIETTYKNLDFGEENPITAVQMSMSTYAQILKEMSTGKILPDEDLDKLQDALKNRIEDLKKERIDLAGQNKAENIARLTSLAAEQARTRDDLLQIPFRRNNPCTVVEIDNKDLFRNLGAKGFMPRQPNGGFAFSNGKSRFWVTKAHGLPIKFETRDEDGRVVFFFCFTELKINSGLRQADLALSTPDGSALIRASADLKDRNWEDKLQKDVQRQIDLYDNIRRPDPKRPRPRTLPPVLPTKKQ
jgi:hypothetical protein